MHRPLELPYISTHRLEYRPAIDGLRAIAVLSVFVFHLEHRWLPGGFLGVDVFFVISGYLITSILLHDLAAGHFSAVRFYQRRIARLFPLFFTVGLATIAGAAFLYSSQDFASAGSTLAATSLCIANLKLILQGNYFAVSADAQPFLHYWSLSVEEQFYLVYPPLLFLLFRYARGRLLPILGILLIASFVANVWLAKVNPVWAFYLLPTRAWELCAGCMLAIAMVFGRPFCGRYVSRLPWLSVVGFASIACCFIWEGAQSSPGWRAAVPVLGTLAIIVPRTNVNLVDKWLSSRVMIRVGKLSYSLYLWHWPVFCFADYRLYMQPATIRIPLKIGLSLLLTILSYSFIESPARNFLNLRARRHLALAGFVAALSACVPLGIAIRRANYVNADVVDVSKGGLVFPGKPDAPSVVLMGDSNGSMYGKVMKTVCSELGEALTVITVAAGDSLPLSGGSDQLWSDSLATVRKTKPDFLVLAFHWTSRLRDNPERLTIALGALKPYVGRIIILNQPPTLPSDASRSSIRDGTRPPFLEPAEIAATREKTNDFLLRFIGNNLSVIDVSRHFESAEGQVLFTDSQGHQLYHDADHLSGEGAKRIRDILKAALTPPGAPH